MVTLMAVREGGIYRGSHLTTLTPRTVYRFFEMYSFVTGTSGSAQENKNRSVETGDAVHVSFLEVLFVHPSYDNDGTQKKWQ